MRTTLLLKGEQHGGQPRATPRKAKNALFLGFVEMGFWALGFWAQSGFSLVIVFSIISLIEIARRFASHTGVRIIIQLNRRRKKYPSTITLPMVGKGPTETTTLVVAKGV